MRLEPGDRELCQAAAGGDHAAFHTLVGRYAPALFRTAMSLCGNRPDAEDVCQETLIAAYAGLRRFNAKASLKTWLTAILIRRSSKLWRSRKRSRNQQALENEMICHGERERHAKTTAAVDRRLDLLESIQLLPEEFRDVAILRDIEGLSYEQIAGALGVPCGTVQSRIHRARVLLKENLSAYRPEDGMMP